MASSGEIRVSLKKPIGAFIAIATETLERDGRCEIHGMSNAMAPAVQAAEKLVSLGYATMQSFQTSSVQEGSSSRNKVVIALDKTPQFQQLYDEYKTKRNNYR